MEEKENLCNLFNSLLKSMGAKESNFEYYYNLKGKSIDFITLGYQLAW